MKFRLVYVRDIFVFILKSIENSPSFFLSKFITPELVQAPTARLIGYVVYNTHKLRSISIAHMGKCLTKYEVLFMSLPNVWGNATIHSCRIGSPYLKRYLHVLINFMLMLLLLETPHFVTIRSRYNDCTALIFMFVRWCLKGINKQHIQQNIYTLDSDVKSLDWYGHHACLCYTVLIKFICVE